MASGGLDSDLRLPFPPIDSDTTTSSSSFISPLSLPRGATGYFDHVSVTSHPTSGVNFLQGAQGKASAVYSPLSPYARGPPQPQPPHFLSPHLTPIGQEVHQRLQHHYQQQPRSASLSPTRRAVSGAHSGLSRSAGSAASHFSLAAMAQSPNAGFPPDAAGFSSPGGLAPPSISSASAGQAKRSSSADASAAPSQSQMIRRLVQQNGRIRQAWEAERKYMEANRERAEEVYKEERTFMEEERTEWETEKAVLLREISALQQQVIGLGGNSRMLEAAKQPAPALTGLRGGSAGGWDGSASLRSSESSQGSSSSSAQPGQRSAAGAGGGGLAGVSLVAGPGSGGDPASLRTNPAAAFQAAAPPPPPQQGLTSPLLLPTPSGSSTARLMSPPQHPHNPQQQPPQLLHLQQNHITSPFLLPLHSPPPSSETGDAMAPAADIPTVDIQEIHPELEGIRVKAPAIQRTTFSDKPPSPPRSNPPSRTPSPPSDPGSKRKEQTLQVLAAAAPERLTMHAGHTPNHSLSVLPSVAGTEAATTASSSGTNTPTMLAAQPDGHEAEPAEPAAEHDPAGAFDEDGPEVLYVAPEDRPLKGPLMVRNMPAHDEIFFRRLSDKLEEIVNGTDAVPSVLKEGGDERAADEEHDGAPQAQHAAGGLAVDGANDAGSRGSSRSEQGEEIEIPLKLRRSNNFGAPFGEMR